MDQDTVSFCTISDSRRHDPAAIWSYLSPVFEYIQHNHSEVNTVHFVSDGPTTQYRQKKNFYLFCTQLYKEGFAGGGSWNFSEAGHSKGAADGVGGVLKRTADDIISRGQDLLDAATLFHALVNTGMSVKLFLVLDSDVNEFSSKVPDNLLSVPGTIHQLVQDSFPRCGVVYVKMT